MLLLSYLASLDNKPRTCLQKSNLRCRNNYFTTHSAVGIGWKVRFNWKIKTSYLGKWQREFPHGGRHSNKVYGGFQNAAFNAEKSLKSYKCINQILWRSENRVLLNWEKVARFLLVICVQFGNKIINNKQPTLRNLSSIKAESVSTIINLPFMVRHRIWLSCLKIYYITVHKKWKQVYFLWFLTNPMRDHKWQI